MDKKTLQDRITSAIWVPVLVIIVTAAIIIGIGELLLALAEVKDHVTIGGIQVNEPLSVLVALIISVAILAGAAFLARGWPRLSALSLRALRMDG